MKRKYKVTAEHYQNNNFIGTKEFFVEAVHCSVAAELVEKHKGYFAVDVERVG